MDLKDNLFMLPGPVKMHPRVLDAMAHPAFAHRSPEFTQILEETRELLKYIFQSDNRVAVISGSGTAGVESVLSNILKKDDLCVSLGTGKFGERLGQMSRVFGRNIEIKTEWGQPCDLEKLAEALEENEVRAVALCHNETSTGLTNPGREVGKLAHKHGALFVLDGITSLGGLDVPVDEFGADYAILGSQKCIAAPAGLAAVSVSDRGYDELYSDSTYYLDLKKHLDKLEKSSQTPYTPAIPLVMAMREALLIIKERGLDYHFDRIARMGGACRAAARAMGLELFPVEKYASNTVTALRYPEGIDDAGFRGYLKEEYNLVIAGAQDHIKGRVFRIGHMGVCSFLDLTATFAALEAAFRHFGVDVPRGAGVAEVAKRM